MTTEYERIKTLTGLCGGFNIPSKVNIIDVTARDGFQSQNVIVPTDMKVRIIDMISQSGVSSVEVTSFVRPDIIPQLADAREVMTSIKKNPDVVYSVLIPNKKGAQNALPCRTDEWGLMVSLSEEHSKANINVSRKDAIASATEIVALAKDNGIRVNGGVLTAFKGDFSEAAFNDVCSLIDVYVELGINIINVADTEGIARPSEVYQTMKLLLEKYPDLRFVGHFHDTEGFVMNNALAALAAGVDTFDCAIGGIGGCPAVFNAGGNLPEESFVAELNALGVADGMDVQCLSEVRKLVEEAILGSR